MPNPFFWYDLMTTDTAAAQSFYADVVGWGLEDAGAPGMPYSILTAGGVGVAGMMPIPERAQGAPPALMGYVHVDDVDAMLEKLTAAGGAIHRPAFDVPGVIRIAVVADPQGAVFMLGQPLSPPARAMPAPGTPGTIGWHELLAADWESVFGFYADLFGWTKTEAHDMGPMGTYQLFAADCEATGGMMTKPAAMPRPFWNYYIFVPSVTQAADKIRAGGGQVTMGPHEVPGGQWVVQGVDPQGGFFALVSNEK